MVIIIIIITPIMMMMMMKSCNRADERTIRGLEDSSTGDLE